MDNFIRILTRELFAFIASFFLVLPVGLTAGAMIFSILAIFGPQNVFFGALSSVLEPFYGANGRIKIGLDEIMTIFTVISLFLFAVSRLLSLFIQKEIWLPSGSLIISVVHIIAMIAIGTNLQDYLPAFRILGFFLILSLASYAIYRFFMRLSDKAAALDMVNH